MNEVTVENKDIYFPNIKLLVFVPTNLIYFLNNKNRI